MLNYDHKHRVVSLSALRAMCKHVSGWSHTYEVTKESRSRVHVSYSNPDEYGNANPITVVFPCYPTTGVDSLVVFDPIRFIGVPSSIQAPWDEFYTLEHCPSLYFNHVEGKWLEYVPAGLQAEEEQRKKLATLEQELLEANRYKGSLFNAARDLIFELDSDIFTDAEECAESVAEVRMLRQELFRWVYSSVGNMEEAQANFKAHNEKVLAELRAQDNVGPKERTGKEEVFQNLVHILEG